MADLKLPSVNFIILSGRLTGDPNMKFTPGGTPVVKFRLASSRNYKNKQTGEWKEDTIFIDVTAFSNLAERCHKRLSKGSPVIVEGRLNQRRWETPEGQKRSIIDIVGLRVQFMEKIQEESAEGNDEDEGVVEDAPDDDLPF